MNPFKYLLVLLLVLSNLKMSAQDTIIHNEPQQEVTKTDSLQEIKGEIFSFYKSNITIGLFEPQKKFTKIDFFETPSQDSSGLNYTNKPADNSVFHIGAVNVKRGSVSVTAGKRQMKEGVDFTVNYQAGTVQIIDPSWEASTMPIKVCMKKSR